MISMVRSNGADWPRLGKYKSAVRVRTTNVSEVTSKSYERRWVEGRPRMGTNRPMTKHGPALRNNASEKLPMGARCVIPFRSKST